MLRSVAKTIFISFSPHVLRLPAYGALRGSSLPVRRNQRRVSGGAAVELLTSSLYNPCAYFDGLYFSPDVLALGFLLFTAGKPRVHGIIETTFT
ncbi:hypothetical protein HOV38_gp43 [Raoultella phage RP180]|uniref:Uncharacterized protein n=1 Tax=Raoultella phage RP180 TaxID=2565500 RepID=A0A4D6DYH3_9CAUD|nr:hypothetical protein HOV38_gp43 [Raoultella phage RP180]QBZ71298.1 hypothetical protein RP180_43 [Raoultella phage RP180]